MHVGSGGDARHGGKRERDVEMGRVTVEREKEMWKWGE